MGTQDAVILTRQLTKSYGTRMLALQALDLEVRRGEIFGYLGPNGAGKTTTIKLLLDLIRPTSGSAALFGMDSRANAVDIHRRIGFLPGELSLWRGQTGTQVLRYAARVRAMADIRYALELAERLKLDLTKRVRDYSSGNRRKLGLTLAMMHKPDLLILDEPTSGLDPLMQQTFNQLMLEAQAEGRTVFLSSHLLSEVQAICDRVGILRDGRLQAVESIERLTQVDFRWITLRLRDGAAAVNLNTVPGISAIQPNGSALRFRMTGDFDPLLRALNGHYVVDLRVQEPTLEEIFLTYYDNGARSTQQVNAGQEQQS